MTGSPNRPRWRFADSRWLLLAIGVFLLQVLPFLSHRWVTDESWYAGPGYSIAHGHGVADPAIGPNDIENHFDARPPGTAILIAFFFKLFGAGQIPARLGSVLAGVAVVTLTFTLARRTFGEHAAILAALLVATDNFLVLAARTARPEALTTFAIVAAMLCMARFRQGSTAWAAASGLLMALGTMFHVTLLGYIVSLGILSIVFDRVKGRTGLKGAVAYTFGFFAGLVPFAVWILSAPLGREGFHTEYLSRALGEPLRLKFVHELTRYSTFFGYDSLHGHGMEHLPVRLAVPLLLLAATCLVWRFQRSWFYVELILLIPSLLWLVDTANKSSRYLAIFAPLLALIAAACFALVQDKQRLRKPFLALASITVATQLGANLILLNAARKADYTAIGTKLRSVVPPGETVYGTITFWLAFDDHPYISYERTDPWMAVNDFQAHYFIAGDRMMTMQSGSDEDFYRTMNQHFQEVVAKSTVVGHFPDPYYGDLVVYRVNR